MSAPAPHTTDKDDGAPAETVDLAIEGMTCASCVARVERKLNRVPGVRATVNLATEQAHVEFAGLVRDADLVAAVESAGYGATVLRRRTPRTTSPTTPAPLAPPPLTSDPLTPAPSTSLTQPHPTPAERGVMGQEGLHSTHNPAFGGNGRWRGWRG